ncbi:hypothetical protein ACFQ4L_00595 [Lapidilactobacillus mulanensis]|uniref:Uncharacterized protein n=1 Tax=Lapidilactobacillus mulanensis TaxID=2485999 RepID=A0ABW4DNU5_9LACO|nr:hypothetical protein [Lapidilactobacillus mulanensis]
MIKVALVFLAASLGLYFTAGGFAVNIGSLIRLHRQSKLSYRQLVKQLVKK